MVHCVSGRVGTWFCPMGLGKGVVYAKNLWTTKVSHILPRYFCRGQSLRRFRNV